MSSGPLRVLFNRNEQLTSPDVERAGDEEGHDWSVFLRWFVDQRTDMDAFAGGITFRSNPVPNVAMHLVNGLIPIPVNGTTSIFVTPGKALFVMPSTDSAGDIFMAEEDGTSLELTFTPNTEGARIDVIECQFLEADVEDDNVDIFDGITTQFFPHLLEKASRGKLIYRIRSGTTGNGYPGQDPAWVPLAIGISFAGATTWDDVTLYDVRPLIRDRERPPYQWTHDLPNKNATRLYAFKVDTVEGSALNKANTFYPDNSVQTRVYKETAAATSATYTYTLRGYFESNLGGYMAGGPIAKGTAGPAVGLLDLSDVNNQEPGFTHTTLGQLWYVWLCFPHNLPRWVKYTDSTAGLRAPSGQRGIPVMSFTSPGSTDNVVAAVGFPAKAITMPAASGFGNQQVGTDSAVLMTVGVTGGYCENLYEAQHVLVSNPNSPFNTLKSFSNLISVNDNPDPQDMLFAPCGAIADGSWDNLVYETAPCREARFLIRVSGLVFNFPTPPATPAKLRIVIDEGTDKQVGPFNIEFTNVHNSPQAFVSQINSVMGAPVASIEHGTTAVGIVIRGQVRGKNGNIKFSNNSVGTNSVWFGGGPYNGTINGTAFPILKKIKATTNNPPFPNIFGGFPTTTTIGADNAYRFLLTDNDNHPAVAKEIQLLNDNYTSSFVIASIEAMAPQYWIAEAFNGSTGTWMTYNPVIIDLTSMQLQLIAFDAVRVPHTVRLPIPPTYNYHIGIHTWDVVFFPYRGVATVNNTQTIADTGFVDPTYPDLIVTGWKF